MNNIDKTITFHMENKQYRQNDYPSHGQMNNIDTAITLHMDK